MLFSLALSVWPSLAIVMAGDAVPFEVKAQSSRWQSPGVRLAPGYVAEIKVSGTWFINPLWDRQYGAGGHPELKSAGEYALPGANEGCLLVAVGDTVLAFTQDDETKTVKGYGLIAFLANDAPEKKEMGRLRGVKSIAGIPLGGKGEASTGGFADNRGVLKVTITIRKSE